MKTACCIIIGSEILRGDIIDKHTSFLASQLKILGFNLCKSVIVPDDYLITSTLRDCVHEFDLVITTGGLGPTSDDITRNSVSQVCHVPLVKNAEVFSFLLNKLGDRAYGANEVQAMIPEGFMVLPNPNGTAVGFLNTFKLESINIDTKNHCANKDASKAESLVSAKNEKAEVTVVSLPGPPSEMQEMFLNHVSPYLASFSETVSTPDAYTVFLISEAKLEELCNSSKVKGVYWGTRFSMFSVSLYVYGDKKEDRRQFIDNLKKLTGPYLIYDSDNVDASVMLTDYLKLNNLTISCAESCTSGLIAKLLTDRSGSSDYFWGGVASYHNLAKMKLLNVPETIITQFTAVSEETAKSMAEGINNISNTSVSVSTTGYADERGLLCLGFSAKGRDTQTITLKFSIHSRDLCRRRYAVSALILTRLYLTNPNLNLSEITSSWAYI